MGRGWVAAGGWVAGRGRRERKKKKNKKKEEEETRVAAHPPIIHAPRDFILRSGIPLSLIF